MKKRSKKLLALLTTAAMAVMMISSVVNAEFKYDETPGTSMPFTKYLVLPKDTPVPDRTFTYSITPGTPVAAADNGGNPIYAGIMNNSETTPGPTVTDVVVSSSDATTDGTATDGITNDTTKKYVEKTTAIDFSKVNFTEPGIYRYILTENVASGTNCLVSADRTVDVYVYDEGGELTFKYVMYMGKLTGAGNPTPDGTSAPINVKANEKCDSYINVYPAQNLTIGKKVSGNQASKDKYFKFTITLTKAGNETSIAVNGEYEKSKIAKGVNDATTDIPDEGYTNPNTLTTNEDGTGEFVFYLQANQYVNLMGIPEGATYEVTEGDYTAEGYTRIPADETPFAIKKTNDATNDEEITFSDETSGTIRQADIKTGFTNDKDGTIPTGVILSVAGLLIVGIFAIIGFVFFGIRSKRRYEED